MFAGENHIAEAPSLRELQWKERAAGVGFGAMATDKSLASLLRALQDAANEEEAIPRLLGSATTLLTLLFNPLNVTLLTAQLLCAPAIWTRPAGLQAIARVMAVFHVASLQILKNERGLRPIDTLALRPNLGSQEWIIAVMKGLDDKSSRWRHLLALGGLLIGFEGQERKGISESLRTKLGAAIVLALNLALEDIDESPELAVNSVVLVVSLVFDLLTEQEKCGINHDALLPRLFWASFLSKEGLHFGYFLSAIDADIVEGDNRKFDWSVKSSTYSQVESIASSPMLSSLGALCRVIAYSVDHVCNVDLLPTLFGDISAFTRSLCIQWRQNKISEIDPTEEKIFLSDDTLQTSLPLLWKLLKSSLFSIVVILNALMEHVLGDSRLSADGAPYTAIQTLHILRNLYFVSSRMGTNSLSQQTFVYLAAIDILSQYPIQAEAFLQEIRAADTGLIPEHPLDRCHDLYFLNTAEHFAIILPPQTNQALLISAATPYLGVENDQRLTEIFEAAHSLILVVFSVRGNAELVANNIYSYVEALFKVFPQNLSSRQFRLAVKMLVNITSPPSPISADQPMLASTILELVRMRAESASTAPAPLEKNSSANADGNSTAGEALSEQCVLILSLIDALPYLPLDLLEDWLHVAAKTIRSLQDDVTRQKCEERFWELLVGGEMDVDRAALCHSWWSSQGSPARETKL